MSSSSLIFAPRTNTLHALPPIQTISPSDIKLKRRHLFNDTIKPQKRLKLDLDAKNNLEDEDVYMEPQETARLRARQITRSYNIFSQFTVNPAMSFNRPARMFCFTLSFYAYKNIYCLASTLPILKSFVSSNKSDIFKCQSVGEDTYLTPPYACAFSYGKLLHFFIPPTTFDIMLQVLRTAVSPHWPLRLNKERYMFLIPPNEMIGT